MSKTTGCPDIAHLTERVRAALSDDLRRPQWRGNPNRYAGHCYVASEVLYHALGGKGSGWVPQVVTVTGVTHWFLRNGDTIVDPTSDQFPAPVDYGAARGCGFLTKNMSARARVLADRAGISLG